MRTSLVMLSLSLTTLTLAAVPARAAGPFMVDVGTDGTIKVGGREVSTEQLPVVAGALAGTDPGARWVVVAAPGAPSDKVASVLASLEQAEVGEVAVRMGAKSPPVDRPGPGVRQAEGEGPPNQPRPLPPGAERDPDRRPVVRPRAGAEPGDAPRPLPRSPAPDGAAEGEKPPLPPVEGASVPIPVRPAPAQAPPPVKVIGDQRFSLLVEQQKPSDGTERPPAEVAFAVSRGALGVQASLGERITARTLVNVFEKHGVSTVETSDGASFSYEQYPSGWVARLRDAWVDVALDAGGHVSLRSGVQEPIVGERGTYTSPEKGYYLVDPAYQPIFELGGLMSSRELGLRGTATLADGRAALDAMVSNGTGQSGEDNVGKDFSARVSGDVVESVHAYGSVLYGVRGADGDGHDLLYVAGAEFRSEHVNVTGSYVGGATDDGVSDPVRFVGAEGSAWLGTDLGAEALDRGALVARAGWFDPSPDEEYPDGWIVLQGALQLWLATPQPHKLMVGLGFADLIPIDASAPVELRVTGQTVWRF